MRHYIKTLRLIAYIVIALLHLEYQNNSKSFTIETLLKWNFFFLVTLGPPGPRFSFCVIGIEMSGLLLKLEQV